MHVVCDTQEIAFHGDRMVQKNGKLWYRRWGLFAQPCQASTSGAFILSCAGRNCLEAFLGPPPPWRRGFVQAFGFISLWRPGRLGPWEVHLLHLLDFAASAELREAAALLGWEELHAGLAEVLRQPQATPSFVCQASSALGREEWVVWGVDFLLEFFGVAFVF